MPKEIYIDENGNERILSSSPSALSGLIDTDISSATQGEVLAVDSNGKWANKAPTYNAKCLKVAVVQGSLSSSVTVSNSANTVIFNNVNIKTDNVLSSFAVGSLSDIPDNLLGCVLQWCSGGACVSSDTLVTGGKVTMSLRAIYGTHTVSAVRLLCIGYDN